MSRSLLTTRLPIMAAAVSIVVPAAVLGAAPSSAAATSADLFISEYVEGSSNNKALEIYNGTGSAVDLAASGYNVQMFFNGSTSVGLTINLVGTVVDGDVFVLAQSSASATILAQADQTNGSGWFNGDDAVVLRKGTTTVDVVGQIGSDPGTEWGTGDASTADNTLRRKDTVLDGDADESNAFDPSAQWDGFATDTFGGLGSHSVTVGSDAAPTVVSVSPSSVTTNVPTGTNVTVTFSEPVNASASSFTLSCSVSGNVAYALTGGPTAYALDPTTPLVLGDVCLVTVLAANVTDKDGTPTAMAANATESFTVGNVCDLPITAIPSIQGSGASAAITGAVATRGVVVGDYEGVSPALRGFYLQDPVGDGNPATSDGIFVFNGNSNSVAVGDVVRVSGAVADFQDQTQITATSVVACGTGTVSPTNVTLPVPASDFLERFEGMLVRLPQELTVTEHFQLGRFGQVVMSSNGRLAQPTNVVKPGADAIALQATNNLNRIIVDDAVNNQNPDPILFGRGGAPLSASNTLRGGDTATGIVGVMTYTWAGSSASGNAYRVRPVNALGGAVPNFQAANPRPATPAAVGGTVKVASMNLLNFFNTFDGRPDNVDNCTAGVAGVAADCRGADTPEEFARQWPKTVAAMVGTGADIIGLVEIENDGYGPTSAIQFLVDRLNDATAPGTYAFVDVDAETGQVDALGTDAIKVGLVFKPGRVTAVGDTAVLNNAEFVNGGDGSPRNRATVAQAFEDSLGGRVVINVNHLKSKGSACDAPDAGDGQGNCNGVRLNAARALADWLAGDPTSIGDADVLITGDLNSYTMEDPVGELVSSGFTNLVSSSSDDAYSYVFDGQWGSLDHSLASGTLRPQVTGVTEWHVNADEPSVLDYNTDFKSANQLTTLYSPDQYRIADHDPLIVGLDLLAYDFTGFSPPVSSESRVDGARAGRTLPVKFGLGGDRGLGVLVPGYPVSAEVNCTSGEPVGAASPTASSTRLQYDPADDRYTYTWQTRQAWQGTCRAFTLAFDDGTSESLVVSFK